MAFGARFGVSLVQERVEVVGCALEGARLLEAAVSTLLHGPAPR
jgi:hypothetical protein